MRAVALAARLSSGCLCGALDDAYARLADSGTDADPPDAGPPDGGMCRPENAGCQGALNACCATLCCATNGVS